MVNFDLQVLGEMTLVWYAGRHVVREQPPFTRREQSELHRDERNWFRANKLWFDRYHATYVSSICDIYCVIRFASFQVLFRSINKDHGPNQICGILPFPQFWLTDATISWGIGFGATTLATLFLPRIPKWSRKKLRGVGLGMTGFV